MRSMAEPATRSCVAFMPLGRLQQPINSARVPVAGFG